MALHQRFHTMSTVANQYLPSTATELQEKLGLIPHPEGGFFLETFRSGSTPMSSRGQTDFQVPDRDLVHCPTRKEGCRPDKDDRRNCLTSIYWVPNATSPVLNVVHNTSDHVHYYQGGVPFEYTIYDPTTKQIQVQVLGPDLANGQSLQVPVAGGLWKCGRLLPDSLPGVDADYCIIAEAVGPGFDFHDFNFVNAKDLEEQGMDVETRQRLEPFLHNMETAFDNAVSSSLSKDSVEKKDKMFDKHYDYAG